MTSVGCVLIIIIIIILTSLSRLVSAWTWSHPANCTMGQMSNKFIVFYTFNLLHRIIKCQSSNLYLPSIIMHAKIISSRYCLWVWVNIKLVLCMIFRCVIKLMHLLQRFYYNVRKFYIMCTVNDSVGNTLNTKVYSLRFLYHYSETKYHNSITFSGNDYIPYLSFLLSWILSLILF